MIRVAVCGIGNVLVGDDAVGPTVIGYLQSMWELPENVVVEDIGTPSLDLVGRLCGFDAAILIDAVSAKLPPGSLRNYTRAEILKHPPSLRLSPHDPSLKETLLTLELLSDGPSDITLVGIVPQSLDQFGLTDVVREAVPAAAEAVIAELVRLGVSVRRRENGVFAPGFWEAA